jgi:hypothetical protein
LAEWLAEQGIGETRAVLVEHGEIVEGRIELEGAAPAGTVLRARLINLGQSGRNAIVSDEQGTEYLLPRTPASTSQGAFLNIEVTREAIPGAEPWKRPLARATQEPVLQLPPLGERLGARMLSFPVVGVDELARSGWSDVVEQAATGNVQFARGTLTVQSTRAMTLIDVDGWPDPAELAVAGAAAAAKAIRRLDISGSIGIDLPTVAGKEARQTAAAAIDAHLPQPFERTAVNGFGFVQVVRPRTHPSLIEIWNESAAAEARALLRRAALEGPGAKRLVGHPQLIAVLEGKPHWLDALARQVGGPVSLRSEPRLAICAAYAEEA